jgi:4-diphosphocytidyl-2-C-methyl-D-erythritol kinase
MGAAVAGCTWKGKMLNLLAPAKINLTLEVLHLRPDGFHEIRSVIQTINLGDSLRFRLSDKLQFSSDNPEFVAEESLVSRAAALLQQASGFSKGATIEISKRIPLGSGLGGDSSDAAAILSGLNKLWRLGLSPAELLALAARLGSDVAFFLYGGTALVEGRGERVAPLPPLPHRWVVLMIPDVPRVAEKTRKLYASLKTNHYTDGQITEKFVRALNEGREFKPSMLFNTFENVAFEFFPKLKVYKEHVIKLGASHVHLAGSGPALFTLFEDKAEAGVLYTRCQQQGLESYLTDTLASVE